MSDAITPVNYCTHAIEDLRQTAKDSRERGLMVAAARLDAVVRMLSTAPKFLLPNCAELIDTENVRETHLELLRLPYPVTVFEAPWRKAEIVPAATVAGVQESLSTRRIALCWEMTEDYTPFGGLKEIGMFRAGYPEGGVFIYPIYYSDELKTWNPGAGGTFVPREFRIPEGHKPTRMTQMMLEVKENAGRLHRNAFQHFAEPFCAARRNIPAGGGAKPGGRRCCVGPSDLRRERRSAHGHPGLRSIELRQRGDCRCASEACHERATTRHAPATVFHVQGAAARCRKGGRRRKRTGLALGAAHAPAPWSYPSAGEQGDLGAASGCQCG
ncbi:hypothetical protein J2794_005791 [Paraburkholderia terricola]|uniref:hypothetical protein n=1 Tax=Paraburkholderia terricola TaxID=169427 RepID=UPI0028623A2D|nr:hypothetical protein [Paraburkholderia terricola]MDR6449653.1 hypothetical protein [Paraburkholderia terricola]